MVLKVPAITAEAEEDQVIALVAALPSPCGAMHFVDTVLKTAAVSGEKPPRCLLAPWQLSLFSSSLADAF